MIDRELLRERVMTAVLTAYGEDELRLVEDKIGSQTLRDALLLIVEANVGRAELFIPHYWAVYYHDGRGPVQPITAQKIVFFADPRDDPRLVGGNPRRVSDIRTLTRDDYQNGLEINAERRKNGEPPFMFVLDRAGPAGAHPFFSELAIGASGRMDGTAFDILDKAVQAIVDSDPDAAPEKKTATIVVK